MTHPSYIQMIQLCYYIIGQLFRLPQLTSQALTNPHCQKCGGQLTNRQNDNVDCSAALFSAVLGLRLLDRVLRQAANLFYLKMKDRPFRMKSRYFLIFFFILGPSEIRPLTLLYLEPSSWGQIGTLMGSFLTIYLLYLVVITTHQTLVVSFQVPFFMPHDLISAEVYNDSVKWHGPK